MSDPEVMRYGFDGFGYKYIDSGSGSDWRTRHPDAEPLYASQPTQSDALKAENERLRILLRSTMNMAINYATGTGTAFDDVIAKANAALQEQSK